MQWSDAQLVVKERCDIILCCSMSATGRRTASSTGKKGGGGELGEMGMRSRGQPYLS